MAGRRRERDRAGRRSARLTGGQKGLIAVAAVLAVALMGVAAWKSLFVRPELPDKGTGPDGSAQEIDWGEGVRPRGGGESTGARASAPAAAGSGRARTTGPC